MDYDLTTAMALFNRYIELMSQKRPRQYHSELAIEAYERLEQLRFLLERTRCIQRHVLSGKPLSSEDFSLPIEARPEVTEVGSVIREAFFHVRLLAESYYYLAARFRGILTTRNKLTHLHALPLLESFEAEGVRNVRNHLLEHPEGRTSQQFSQDHSLGGENGPELEVGTDNASHVDKGMFVNASEFKQELGKTLSAAIKVLEAE